MAFDSYPRRPASHGVAVTFNWRRVPRVLRIGRMTAWAIFAALPLLATWYLGATAYLVFHDQLLASLIARQTDMQYAYEDRIAVLRTQLDRETSRGLVDRQSLSTTIRDLVSHSEQLAARAVTIDGLVNSLNNAGGPRGRSQGGFAAFDNPLLSLPQAPIPGGASSDDAGPTTPAPLLRLDQGANADKATDEDRSADHADLTTEQIGNRLSTTLADVEARQTAQVARLREPMMRSVARLKMALTETGLPLARLVVGKDSDGGVGGPFVPLPEGARPLGFDQNVALLQQAMIQHARLIELAARVPLRRPLHGPLEVTSAFGARLDPFYGRAAMHTGIDFMQPYGGTVVATAAGIVTVAGTEGGYGNMVEIDHGNGVVTRYAHLSSIDVGVHQKVVAGEVVGKVGSTGRATGPHLHYETRINGEPVDPSRFLKAGASLFPG